MLIIMNRTYLSLNHLVPLISHFVDRIEGIDHSLFLCPLYLHIDGDESARTAHTSTATHTHTHNTHTHTHTLYIYIYIYIYIYSIGHLNHAILHTLNSAWYPVSPSLSNWSSSFIRPNRAFTGISVPPDVVPSRIASYRNMYWACIGVKWNTVEMVNLIYLLFSLHAGLECLLQPHCVLINMMQGSIHLDSVAVVLLRTSVDKAPA